MDLRVRSDRMSTESESQLLYSQAAAARSQAPASPETIPYSFTELCAIYITPYPSVCRHFKFSSRRIGKFHPTQNTCVIVTKPDACVILREHQAGVVVIYSTCKWLGWEVQGTGVGDILGNLLSSSLPSRSPGPIRPVSAVSHSAMATSEHIFPGPCLSPSGDQKGL